MNATQDSNDCIMGSERVKKCNIYESVSVFVIFTAIFYIFDPWALWMLTGIEWHQSNRSIILTAGDQLLSVRFHEVNCSENGYKKEELLKAAPQHCGTVVDDRLIENAEALKLRSIVETSIAHFGYTRKDAPENVNIKRIKLFEFLIRGLRKEVIDQSDYELIKNVSERVKRKVSSSFGIQEENLHFTPICEATRFKPITQFQEFRHVDKVRSPPLIVTSIIWLSTCGEHFDGGRLHFMTDTPFVIEPKLGRFAAWTSGYECPHEVQELTFGERYGLLFAFSVDPNSGHKTIDEMLQWYRSRV